MSRLKLTTVIPYAILLAEVLVFYRHVLFYDGFVIPWDLRYDHFPIASFMAESLGRGELPLWDPFTYCGRPLYANMQAQLFYPPTVVTLLVSNWSGGENLLYVLEWQIVLHVFLAGIFTFWLMREIGAAQPAALLGASVYQLGCFFTSQAQHLGGMDGAAWLPLAWLSILKLRDGWSARWMACLAACLSMVILAGLPSLVAVVFLSCGLLAAALVVFRLAPVKLFTRVAGALAGAVFLAAAQVLPTVELTWLSVAQYRSDWLGTGGGLPLESLVSLVAPNYYGIFDLTTYTQPSDPTFLYVYSSIAGLVLAVAAALFGKDRQTRMFALLVFVSALWMLGDSTPIGKAVFVSLPSFIQIGLHPEFALAPFALSMAILAGLGAHLFLKRPAVGYTAVAVVALDLILVGSGRPMNESSTRVEPGVHDDHFDGSRELLASLRASVNQDFPPSRIDTVDDSLNWAMCSPITRVPTANGNDPFALERIIQVRLAFCDGERWGRYYEVTNPGSPVLDLLNVRFLLSRNALRSAPLDEIGLTYVRDLPGRQLYENREPLPRFFLVDRVREVAGMAEAARWLHSEEFDPRGEAIVEGEVSLPDGKDLSAGTVTLQTYAAREIVLDVDSPAPGFLVTSEAHYPGWRAFVDGREQQIPYTNVAFRGLEIPAGRHRVVMRFEPSILGYSVALSALAWVLLVALLLWGGKREPRG